MPDAAAVGRPIPDTFPQPFEFPDALKIPRNHHTLEPRTGCQPRGMPGVPAHGRATNSKRKSVATKTGRCDQRGVAMNISFPKRLMVSAMVVLGVATAPVRAAEPTAVGLWEQVDEKTGKPESWFKITERNGVYQGNIVKIFFKPGEDENWVCEKCEGDERGKPVLGLALIKGMQRKGDDYENGTIMDPRDGSVYRALMKLVDGGQKLEVRGYLGISLFGRTQTWNRLPDNALAPTAAKGSPKNPAKK
jgi:uncharacterized protein (DUF2147 family)